MRPLMKNSNSILINSLVPDMSSSGNFAISARLHYQDLIHLFNQTFAESENTHLVKGQSEPIYLPANDQVNYHRIIFAHGFFASALHEIAHWCVAGQARRLLEDYGYWYCPDGRNMQQQTE
jgi:elongation factor P hydroxylase